MRNALHSRIHAILTWLAVVAMCVLAFLLLAMPAPARVEPSKAQAQAPATDTVAATPVTIDGIDVEYLPARFYEEQKRAAMQEPAPTF